MKYVKYQLKSDGSQPSYSNNASFSGGAYKCGEWYVGYLYGTTNDMQDFISNNSDFSMVEISQDEAIQLIKSSLPMFSIDNYGNTIYPSPKVQVDGTIIITWNTTPQGMPTIVERLDAVETAIIDLIVRG